MKLWVSIYSKIGLARRFGNASAKLEETGCAGCFSGRRQKMEPSRGWYLMPNITQGEACCGKVVNSIDDPRATNRTWLSDSLKQAKVTEQKDSRL